MADVGHARADEHFIDLGTSNFSQCLHIVRIVGACHDRFVDVGQVDLDNSCVVCIRVALEQLGVLEPGFLGCDTAGQGTGIRVTIGNHPLHHGDVAVDVLLDRLFVQVHGATCGRALSRRVRQLKRLLDLQVWQTFDFEDTAGEDVLLTLLLDSQQAGLDRVQGNRIHQVTQGHSRLHLALEAHQHRLRHVQRHHAGCCSKRHQTGTCGEADTDRETGVAVATSAHGIRQQQAVEPGVDHAVTGAQADAAAGADEVRQLVVHLHIHGLGVSRGVAERLHHQVGREAQASQVFQLVAGHRAGGVLRADGGHLGLAISARAHALAFGQTAGTADHLLGQAETLLGIHRVLGQAEQCGRLQAQSFTGFGSQATADDQGDTATSAHFVKQHFALDFERCDFFAVLESFTVIGAQFHHITHGHLAHIQLNRQRAGVFHGVVENRGDFAAQADSTETLVGDKRNVLAGKPQHGVGRRLARRTSAHHIAHVGYEIALCAQVFEELDRATLAIFFRGNAGAGILVHCQRMQRNVRAAPSVRCRRQVVGVDFTSDLENADRDGLGHFRAAGKPLGIGPALQHSLGKGIALVSLFLDVMELVEHQQSFLQAFSGFCSHCRVVQQIDHRADVVAAQHGAQQFGGTGTGDQGALFSAVGHSSQVAGFDLGGIVHTSRHAVGNQFDESCLFAGGGRLEQLDQFAGLLGRQRQGGNAQRSAFSHMVTVSLQHLHSPSQKQ